MALKDYSKRDFFISYFDILFNMRNFLCSLKLCPFWGFSCFFKQPTFSILFPPSPPFITLLARYFEVISSNRKNSMFLRAKDPAMAQSWYNAIQSAAAALLPQVKEEMKSMHPGMDVKHLGWLTEQVLKDINVQGNQRINHIFYSFNYLIFIFCWHLPFLPSFQLLYSVVYCASLYGGLSEFAKKKKRLQGLTYVLETAFTNENCNVGQRVC